MKTTLLLLIISTGVYAQSGFAKFISYLYSISDPAVRTEKTDSFMLAHQASGFPVIDGDSANFIYRGSASTVTVAGDFNGWSSSSAAMSKVQSTNFFYYSREFEMNARIDYKFVTNGSSWILDPLNPKTCAGGFGPNSELAMPHYVQPLEIIYNPAVPHGRIITTSLQSTNTSSTFQVKIYLPPGYDSLSANRYSAVYFQDGYEYIDLAYAANVLDNLIAAGDIAPVIGVFVRPNNRNNEYAGTLRSAYKNFFVAELVPYIDANYKTISSPAKRLVLGDSYGGNISAYIAYHHPDVFGNCGVHSGAFQPNSYEVYNLFVNNPAINVRFVSVWGTYESLFTNMRMFRDNLISKGYFFKWLELPEGHSWGLWRATLDYILVNIFPPATSIDKREPYISGRISLVSYPNPFTETAHISYTVNSNEDSNEPAAVTLIVYDLLGRKITELVNTTRRPGTYEVEFNPGSINAETAVSGAYILRLNVNQEAITKKILFIK